MRDDAGCSDCLSSAEYDKVANAIDQLKNNYNYNGLCAEAAWELQNQLIFGEIKRTYDAGEYGHMEEGSPNIWLASPAFWAGELANTLAHEESHLWGWSDPSDPDYSASSGEDSTAFGNSCAGVI